MFYTPYGTFINCLNFIRMSPVESTLYIKAFGQLVYLAKRSRMLAMFCSEDSKQKNLTCIEYFFSKSYLLVKVTSIVCVVALEIFFFKLIE